MIDKPLLEARLLLLRQAIADQPDAVGLRYDLAELLVEAGQPHLAAVEYLVAYHIEPQLRPHSITLDQADMVSASPQTARVAAALLQHGVTASAVLLARAWSAALLGQTDVVRHLIDADRFLQIVPRAMPDLMTQDFVGALLSEVEEGMTSYRLPWQEIRRANRNSTVLAPTAPLGSRLAARLRHEVDAYVQTLGPTDHPFVAGRPSAYRLEGWSVTFDGASRHVSHIHPHGWLSGVLYLDTAGLNPDKADRRGWLRVGSPDGIDAARGWPERWIEPKVGTLVLFPSYFAHETMPLGSEGRRVCIAFDVVPENNSPS